VTAAGLKLLGGVLLVLAGALLGRRALAEQRARLRRLHALAAALGRLRTELLETRAPLPEILDRLRAEPLLDLAAAGFGAEPTETLWRRAAAAQPVPEEARAALASLGAVLGRCSAERQAEELSRVRRALEEQAALAEETLRTRTRQYPGLGAAAGAVLAVLLF